MILRDRFSDKFITKYHLDEIDSFLPLGKDYMFRLGGVGGGGGSVAYKKPPNNYVSIHQRSQAISYAVQQTALTNEGVYASYYVIKCM